MIYFCGNAEKARVRRAAGGDRPGDFLIFYGAAAFGGPALLMGRRAYAIIKANRYSEIKKCRNGDGMGGMKIIKGMGKLLSRLAGYLAALWRQRQRLNQWMARRYTSAMLALIGTLVCLAVALYLPAVYLVLKAGLERVRYFSEAVAVTALGC